MMKRSELLIKIYGMSFCRKIQEAFICFPSLNYELLFEAIKDDLCSKRLFNIKLYTSSENHAYISIHVEGVGTFDKYFETEEYGNNSRCYYQFGFTKPGYYEKVIKSKEFNKIESDEVCKYAIPYMVSLGKMKEHIPLLINTYPEFAEYVLKL